MITISGKRWVECTNKGQISIPESIDPETQVLFHVWTFSTIFSFQFHNFAKWPNIFQSYNFVSHVIPKNPLIFENFRLPEILTGSFDGGVKHCESPYVSIIFLSDS